MNQSFFTNPLWRKFQDSRITVHRLSDGEHRLRDAYANMFLKEFLPPDTRFLTHSVNGIRGLATGSDNEGGIVILGRPSLFPKRIRSMLKKGQPPLLYHFASDKKSDAPDYRSIVRKGLPRLRKRARRPEIDKKLLCESFDQQRRSDPEKLSDNAIVYSGWHGKRPLMLLAGSSTVGTWGAVHYVTKAQLPVEKAIWQLDVQGVVRAEVWADDEAFEEVESQAVELLSPTRFWLEGGSCPPVNGWTREVLKLESDRGIENFDLRILVNGQAILTKRRNYVAALVLLAWLSNRTCSYEDGFCAEINSGQALRSIFGFLQISKQHPINLGEFEIVNAKRTPILVSSMHDFAASKVGRYVCETLKELTLAIREAGGIAYADENETAPGDEAHWTFRLVSRELPHFFPTVR
jgi:hypothetical protein